MRVSDSMRFQGFVPTYQNLVAEQLKLQQQISSGKKILVPSDDTAGAARSQMYNYVISEIAQDQRNIEQATNWSQTSESSVSTTIDYVQRAQELAVQASDVTLSPQDLQSIGTELEQIIHGVIDAAGQRYSGNAVFSGTRTDVDPFAAVVDASGQVTAVNYQGNAEDRQTEISPGRNTTYNLLGSNENGGQFGVFRDTAKGIDVFNTLIKLRDAVQAGDRGTITSISIPELTGVLSHLTDATSRLGGVQDRMLAAGNVNDDMNQINQDSLSKASDTDIASAATQYAQLQTAYQAALATGAKMMTLSLVNYLPTS